MTERVLGPTGSSRRRRRLLVATALLGALMTVFFVTASNANLTGSSFNAGDGNLLAAAGDPNDWANASINCTSTPKVGCALDKPTGTTDDSFGQGTSENDDPPSVVAGSIPNNKSDLTRFYIKSSKENNKDFLYLAWERVQEPTGTTNMDFEFNQNYCLPGEANPPAQNSCSSNGVTPNRSQGDVLIKYDLSNGGTNPTLGYHYWQTAAGNPGVTKSTDIAAICEAGNKFPCWGKVASLAGNFEGAINSSSTDDPINPDATRTLSARTFGEAGINLTDSGLFPAGQCKNFGSAYLKSRSSDSFTAEIKDFIAPLHVNISNCGKIELVKDFVGAPSSARANLLIKDSSNATKGSKTNAADGEGTGEVQVLAGTFAISETAGTDGTTATDLANYSTTVACIDQANSDASVTVSSQALTGSPRSGSVVVGVGTDVKCTFTNTLLTGAIKVTKTGKDKRCTAAGFRGSTADATCVSAGVRRLSGATFQLKKGSAVIGNMTETSTLGVYCTDGLLFGTDYTVQETVAPSGYKRDDTAVSGSKTVSASGTCSTGTQADAGTYTDSPLSSIQVVYTSEAGAGVAVAQIVCKQGSTVLNATTSGGAADENGNADNETTPVRDDTNETFRHLDPNLVYTCTVDVDP